MKHEKTNQEKNQWQIVMYCSYLVAGISLLNLVVNFLDYRLFAGSTFAEFIYNAENIIRTFGIAFILALFLRNLCKTKSPFSKKSMRYLTALGVWTVINSILLPILVDLIVSTHEEVTFSIRRALDGETAGIFMGCALLVIAGVFQYGIRLQEDVDSIA